MERVVVPVGFVVLHTALEIRRVVKRQISSLYSGTRLGIMMHSAARSANSGSAQKIKQSLKITRAFRLFKRFVIIKWAISRFHRKTFLILVTLPSKIFFRLLKLLERAAP